MQHVDIINPDKNVFCLGFQLFKLNLLYCHSGTQQNTTICYTYILVCVEIENFAFPQKFSIESLVEELEEQACDFHI